MNNVGNLVILILNLIYAIFMLNFLKNAEKYDNQLSKTDKEFRKVAYIITAIAVAILAISVAFIMAKMASSK